MGKVGGPRHRSKAVRKGRTISLSYSKTRLRLVELPKVGLVRCNIKAARGLWCNQSTSSEAEYTVVGKFWNGGYNGLIPICLGRCQRIFVALPGPLLPSIDGRKLVWLRLGCCCRHQGSSKVRSESRLSKPGVRYAQTLGEVEPSYSQVGDCFRPQRSGTIEILSLLGMNPLVSGEIDYTVSLRATSRANAEARYPSRFQAFSSRFFRRSSPEASQALVRIPTVEPDNLCFS